MPLKDNGLGLFLLLGLMFSVDEVSYGIYVAALLLGHIVKLVEKHKGR